MAALSVTAVSVVAPRNKGKASRRLIAGPNHQLCILPRTIRPARKKATGRLSFSFNSSWYSRVTVANPRKTKILNGCKAAHHQCHADSQYSRPEPKDDLHFSSTLSGCFWKKMRGSFTGGSATKALRYPRLIACTALRCAGHPEKSNA